MEYSDFKKMMKKYNDEEREQIKHKLKNIICSVDGKTIYEIISLKNPPLKAFNLAEALQKLFQDMTKYEKFTDTKWLECENTVNQIKFFGQFNLKGVHGLLWLIECLNRDDLSKQYQFLEQMID